MPPSTATPLPKDSPIMKAWDVYKKSDDYATSFKWAAQGQYRHGSMWAAFLQGWTLAIARAESLHEQINPASDAERLAGDPGAGAMGAVIEYRDAIRSES